MAVLALEAPVDVRDESLVDVYEHDELFDTTGYSERIASYAELLQQHCDVTPIIQLDGFPGGVNALAKYEAAQVGGSFKARGAYVQLHEAKERGERYVCCASAGNFGIGTALAAKQLSVEAVIYVPETASPERIQRIVDAGRDDNGYEWATVFVEGENVNKSLEAARSSGFAVVEPFDSESAVAAHATVAKEAAEQLGGEVSRIFVAVGGGGLTAGTLLALEKNPDIEVVAVQIAGNDSLERSLADGEPVPPSNLNPLAAGSAATVGQIPFEIIKKYRDRLRIVTVSAAEVGERLRREIELRQQHEPAMGEAAYDHLPEVTGMLAETGAYKVACEAVHNGYDIRDETWVAVVSGSNIDEAAERKVLEAHAMTTRRALGTKAMNYVTYSPIR